MRYKARPVAQVEGVDYFGTYAPVARLPSSRAVIAMANRLVLELHQFDIKGAYLNGELAADEASYMWDPPGYRGGAFRRILYLRKFLYGLKQACRRCYRSSRKSPAASVAIQSQSSRFNTLTPIAVMWMIV